MPSQRLSQWGFIISTMQMKGLIITHPNWGRYHVFSTSYPPVWPAGMCQLHTSGLIFNFTGSKFTNVKGARRYRNRFREHEKLIWGASRKINQGAGRKGSNFKGSRELGTPPPLAGSRYSNYSMMQVKVGAPRSRT